MRVLYLTGKLPVPANSGDALRNLALLRAARTVATRLDLVTLPQGRGAVIDDGLSLTEGICDSVTVVGRAIGDQLGRPVNRLRTVLGRPYYHSVGDAPDVRTAVRSRLAAVPYDVVVVGQIFLASALPSDVLPRTVYDSHNVHHLRMQESLGHSRLLPERVRDRIVRQVHDQEAGMVGQVAATVACSERDAVELAGMRPGARVTVIPNGTSVDAAPRHTGAAGRPLFLASLDASANIEALAHLVDDVLPHLRADVRVDVAGSNARPVVDAIITRSGGRLRYLGEVEDARATMARGRALLVPLRTGEGTRLKVLEAFAVGLPVVSTTKGVEGIPVTHDRHALIADDPAHFATAVHRLIDTPAVGHRLAGAARELVENGFSWPELGARFAELLVEVGTRHTGTPRTRRDVAR